MRILGCVRGRARARAPGAEVTLNAGDFCLLPAALSSAELVADTDAELIHVQPGRSSTAPA
jgi:uncharacterized protein YjlB